jgi:hypothetical protein
LATDYPSIYAQQKTALRSCTERQVVDLSETY